MSQLLLADRYARALSQSVDDGSELDTARDELEQFAEAYTTNTDLAHALDNPSIESDRRIAVLEAVLEGTDSPAKRLLLELFRRGRLAIVRDIANVFHREADNRQGRIPGSVTSSHALSDEQLNDITSSVSAYAGKAVELTTELDPEILGGIVVRIGDTVIDGSLKTRLTKLKQALLAEENGSNENSSH